MAARQFVAILAVTLLVGACGEAPPSPDVAASVGATCDADFTVTGGYEGRVTGPVTAAARPIGEDGGGVAIDAYPDIPQDGVATRFLFGIFDPDGPDGPQSINALFGAIDPAAIPSGWNQGTDPGTASLAADGSNATFAIEFSGGLEPAFNVTGSIDCPPLP